MVKKSAWMIFLKQGYTLEGVHKLSKKGIGQKIKYDGNEREVEVVPKRVRGTWMESRKFKLLSVRDLGHLARPSKQYLDWMIGWIAKGVPGIGFISLTSILS